VKPRILDLFCGAGGAAMGLYRAGFEVVGVDIKTQPHYPFEFHQADAMTYPLEGFDAYWASPPCQRYSSATPEKSRANHPDLYISTREKLQTTGKPWILENVIGAPYGYGIILCGSMFELAADGEWIQRHRNFETSWMMMQPQCFHPTNQRPVTVTGKCFVMVTTTFGRHSRQGPFSLAQKLMGIDWTTRNELAQAIPPAYSEYLGKYLMRCIK
jgi:DNA (cytosine-5)-methyltransferase 1